MGERLPITYGEFYDVPRMIRFRLGARWYFLRSYFDDTADEYADAYDVYELPFQAEAEVEANNLYWMKLEGAVHLGKIAVDEIGLDETRRRSVDGGAFKRWLASVGRGRTAR
jgi:hypothetical protein